VFGEHTNVMAVTGRIYGSWRILLVSTTGQGIAAAVAMRLSNGGMGVG